MGKMENINLVRKIAWSFHHSTGLEWEDLFQEAYLAYHEGLCTYKPEKGALSTYMWTVIGTRLKNYFRDEQCKNLPLVPIEEASNRSSSDVPFWWSLTRDAIKIAEFVLQTPESFTGAPPSESQERIRRYLLKQGWSARRINRGLRDLKGALL